MKINELLSAPPSIEVGQALLAWAKALAVRIVSGEMIIGILSMDEVALAPKALRKASDCGIEGALLALGNWLAAPPFGEPDLAGARAVFREAISAGVPGAKLKFAEFLWFRCRDIATSEEQQEAYILIQEVASSGGANSRAVYLLGMMTCSGFGTRAEPARAFEILNKAAQMDDADAVFELYLYYEMGVGVQKNSIAALEHLQLAANRGHPRGMYNLAACLATGRGVPKNLVKAADWYFRASEAGNLRATANLAMMYAKGEGVEKDLEQAELLFGEAEYMGVDVSGARASVGL